MSDDIPTTGPCRWLSFSGLEEGVMRYQAMAGLLALVAFQSVPAAQGPTLVKSIELPGVEGRIDHLAFDAATHRLFVAALGNNTVEVLDVERDAHLKSLKGFREPQGVASLTGASRVAVANGEGDGLQFVDPATLQLTSVISLGDDADNVRYDAASRRVYVGFGDGMLAAVDAERGQVVGKVRLAGHPESFQLERSGPRIFVNVPSAAPVAVIDRESMKVVATWPVTGAASNYPMALDEPNHRLFIGCRRPAKVLVYDTATGKQAASFDIVGDTDDLFYDGAKKRLYVTGGNGFLDVYDASSAQFSRVAHLATAAGARTSLYVPEQNRLYLAVPHRGSQRAEIRVYEDR